MPCVDTALSLADRLVYAGLSRLVNRMPPRLARLVVHYYTDARVRRLYWPRFGLDLGDRSYANLGVRVVREAGRYRVRVGCNVSIAPDVVFVCESTANNGLEINTLDYVRDVLTRGGDIVVEDDVWIGVRATILPGVTIGRCAVIGACSLVLSDVEPYSVYAGVPARRIRDLRTGDRVRPSSVDSRLDKASDDSGEGVGTELHG